MHPRHDGIGIWQFAGHCWLGSFEFRTTSGATCTPERVPLGVLDAWLWARDDDGFATQKPNDRPIEEKESIRWLEGYQRMNETAQLFPDTLLVTNPPGAVLDRAATRRVKYMEVFHQSGCFRSVPNQIDEQRLPRPAGHGSAHPDSTIEAPSPRCSEKFATRYPAGQHRGQGNTAAVWETTAPTDAPGLVGKLHRPGVRPSPLYAVYYRRHKFLALYKTNLSGTDLDRDSDPKGEIHGRISSKRDEKIITTVGASCPRKAMSQDATLQILAEILLDVGGNRETFLIRVPAAGQPRVQMALHHLINRAALRLPAAINRCTRRGFRLALRTPICSHHPIRE